MQVMDAHPLVALFMLVIRSGILFLYLLDLEEKLNQDLIKVLRLVSHLDRDHLEQSTRLTSAWHWSEESGTRNWPLVVDNVN